MTYKKSLDFIVDDNGCFVCTSHKPDSYGYPQMKMNNFIYKTHRFSYEQCFGEIPEGLLVRHNCDNRSCVNPEHLLLGTHVDNMKDMKDRGRAAKGESNGNSVLTRREVMEIKQLLKHGFSYQKISNFYNVGKTTISHIKKGRTWRNI